MSKRLITERQQEILMLVHHEFQGLSRKEAADKLGISSQAISDALRCIEEVLPQYFPILSKSEAKCYNYYMNEGWSVVDTAEYLDMTVKAVRQALDRAKRKGAWWAPPKGRVKSYDKLVEDYGIDWVDEIIKEKF